MDNINYTITSLVDILGLVQGLFLGVYLMIENKKNRPTLLLGAFLIAFSFELLDTIIDDTNLIEHYPSLLFLPVNFHYLTMPLFYLYVKHITDIKLSNRHILTVLLPGIIEFVMISIIFLLPTATKIELHENEFFIIPFIILIILSFPYSVFYVIKTIKHIHKHNKKVNALYSNTAGKRLIWARRVAYFMLVFSFLWIIEVFQEENFFEDYTYPILSAINVLFIFWIGISGLKQSKIAMQTNEMNVPVAEKNGLEALSTAESQQIIALMETDKLYKESDLSLADFAKAIGIPQRNLSQLIKQHTNKNFNQFVNYYRVEEAKRLLKDPEYDNLNMLGIAFESGFSSKATFYAVFKQFVGKTPNAYKQAV
ncbi:helix-turn-helix transcriptional regulator [uncultured Kordia sp.]|uniref:helix-turn-helix domain-containing protein n=1 Tax=uncultured Kordia sp. TaxID=507699 RepID=UPI00262714A9|nr:helix-turn-helix transcriptional regulator [uncultured Kordia sp.]